MVIIFIINLSGMFLMYMELILLQNLEEMFVLPDPSSICVITIIAKLQNHDMIDLFNDV